MRSTSQKVDLVVVELSREDVVKAVAAAAEKDARAGMNCEVDPRFTPQVIEDGFGGFKVYFREVKKEVKPR